MRVLLLLFSVFCLFAPAQTASPAVLRQTTFQPSAEAPVQRLDAGGRFRALGLIGSNHFHARVRSSLDGVGWGAWREVEVGHEGGSLLWFDEGARWVEILAPDELRVLFIEPGETKLMPRPAQPETAQPQTGSVPPIVSRAGWGCGAECAPREQPLFAPVTHLVVHHSAGSNTATDWAAVIRSIWVLHVRGNGWNDIGYNYLIDPNGVIYEGRAGGDGVIGAHFSGVNTGTMGVCLVGTYSEIPPRAASIESLWNLLSWQVERWNLDISGQTLHAASGLTLNVVSGHRDAGLSPRASGSTECPGNALYVNLPSLRRLSRNTARCQVLLPRRNFCAGASGADLSLGLDNPVGCPLPVEGAPSWLQVREGRLEFSPNPGARRTADLKIAGQVLRVVQAESGVETLPCPAVGSVVNAASFDNRPLGQGAIASLFGSGLEGSRVIVNNTLNATVFASNDTQINFALPTSVPTGSARLVVEKSGVRSPELMFWVTEAAPSLFTDENGFAYAQWTADRRIAVVYLTGIGSNRRLSWEARIGGRRAEPLFLGLTPGFIGLGQANLGLAEGLEAGDSTLEVIVAGASSPSVRLKIPE
jgi:uncharacterized protein (TIGR03437 family)